MRIKYSGRAYELAAETIKKNMKGVEPETGRRFFVSINGISYPIKQVFGRALGLPTVAFSTGYAHNVLSRLGFDIIDAQEVRHE